MGHCSGLTASSLKKRLLLHCRAECFETTESVVSVCVSPHFEPLVGTRRCFVGGQCAILPCDCNVNVEYSELFI
jgi:hypothetical protein